MPCRVEANCSGSTRGKSLDRSKSTMRAGAVRWATYIMHLNIVAWPTCERRDSSSPC